MLQQRRSLALACFVGPVAAALAGCDRAADARAQCDLPPVSEFHQKTDVTAVFTLPDSGGFLANGAAVDRARLAPLLREIFALRPPETRAVFVWRPTDVRCSDVAYIATVARAAGGAAYDAASSGWLTPNEPPRAR